MTHQFVRVDKQGPITILTIDNPPVNALSQRLLEPLYHHVQIAQQNASAIIITGTGKFFVSGADIKEFAKFRNSLMPIYDWFDQIIEQSRIPVVIAINGICLGGGCEFAMSGHYRIALPNSRFGLVELRLGLLPGAGGTQRLPRLVGVKRATEMMLYSEEISGKEALEIGLVDELVESPDELIPAAIRAAKKLIGKPIRRTCDLTDKLNRIYQDEQIVTSILGNLRKKGKTKNQIHFDLCADAILAGIMKGFKRGCQQERKNFFKLITSTQSRGLINVFFSQRKTSQIPGITDNSNLRPKKISTVAVIGGGTMGSGIATWLLSNRIPVILKEINLEASNAAKNRIQRNLEQAVKLGKMTTSQMEKIISLLTLTTDYSKFGNVDLVIEAVFEKLELKKSTFLEVSKHTKSDVILATNTSFINLDLISESIPHRRNSFIGLHFFAPPHIMKLVEVVRTNETSNETILSAIQFCKNLRKIPILVGNCFGFLVNRIFVPQNLVADFLVKNGIHPYKIDSVMTEFGMAMGPFRTRDLSGLDVGQYIRPMIAQSFKNRMLPQADTMSLLVKAGRLGEKSGVGYYKYVSKKAIPDPSLDAIIRPTISGNLNLSNEDIAEMIIFGIANEACRCLDEGIALKPSDIDIATVYGYGFPPYRGGIMHYCKTIGWGRVKRRLEEWYTKFGYDFFKPSPYMEKMDRSRL